MTVKSVHDHASLFLSLESDVLEDSASSEEKTGNVMGKERRNAVKKELKSAGRMGRESFSDEEKVNVSE